MKTSLTLLLFVVVLASSKAQTTFKHSVYQQLTNKNFYFLQQLFSYEEELLAADISSASFYESIKQKEQERNNLLAEEEWNHNKIVKTYLLSNKEIEQGKQWLASHLQENQEFVTTLRASGAYAQLNHLSNEKLIEGSFSLCAKALNYIIKVYGLGESQRYPTIDSVAYDPQSSFFTYSVASWAGLVENKLTSRKQEVFIESNLFFALSLLYMNHRDEAIRYEPLTSHNAKAIQFANNLDGNDYNYSSIIVLGNGPKNRLDRLTSLGKLNLQLGVIEFLKEKAPFIIVSGGHVHPFRSVYAEAIEMKKELLNVYGINEKHIIIEPYARHTTTNLRNATRLMISYDISILKPSLIVTNKDHSNYTSSPEFMNRSVEELGYKVGEMGTRINNTTIEFYPSVVCTQQNPFEPLDP